MMADDNNNDDDQKQPQIVINAGQPPQQFSPPGSGAGYAVQPPDTEKKPPVKAAPQDLQVPGAGYAGWVPTNAPQQAPQPVQQQPIPDKNINLGVPPGGMQQTSYNQPQTNPAQDEYLKAAQAQVDAIRQQGQAAKASAALLGQQGLEENQQYNESNQKVQDLTADYEAKNKQISDELHNTLKDLNNGHINPDQFHENQSVPQRISTAIGMIIAGAGSGLLHQENPVIKWVNSQIERDIDAQKNNINSAYSHYREQMGDSRQAENMSRAILQQNLANQIRSTAAKYAGPLAQQNANSVASQFEGASQKLIGEIAMQKAQQKQLNNMNQMAANGQLEPEQQAIMLRDSGRMTKEDFSKAMTEIGQARNAMQNHKAIMDAWDRGRAQFKMAGLREAPGNSEFENLITPVMRENDGKINTTELDNMKKLESGAWKLPGTEASNRATIEQYINAKKATPFSSGFGIRFPNQPQNSFKPYGQ